MHRAEFPILQQKIAGKPLVYLDSAGSAQKPQVVLDSIQNYYQQNNANVHRGVHTLGERATDAYETARQTVRHFLNAPKPHEIIFTRGATESINLVASSLRWIDIASGRRNGYFHTGAPCQYCTVAGSVRENRGAITGDFPAG